MNWNLLTCINDVDQLVSLSLKEPCIIFKYSSRCSLSDTYKLILEQDLNSLKNVYFLDLIRYKEESEYIADYFDERHESPQVLIVYHGECIFEASHMEINSKEILEIIEESLQSA